MELMAHKFTNWDFYSSLVTEGRILIIWRKIFVRLIIIEETNQYVNCFVKMAGQRHAFSATFVYGLNTVEERKRLRQSLPRLTLPAKSWVILGDFNAIFIVKNRSGGKPISKSELTDSSQWLAGNQVDSIKSTGSFFTWKNNQDGPTRIYSKIDHVFTNEDWLDFFPNSTAVFRWETASNHCSCIVSATSMENMGVKLFRFYNFWTDHQDFKEVVLNSWRKPINGAGLKAIYLKTMRLKHRLKRFNRDNIGDIGVKYQAAKGANVPQVFCSKKQNYLVTEGRYEHLLFSCLLEKASFMGSPNSDTTKINLQCVELGTKLSIDQQLSLLKPFSHKEIRDAYFSIPIIKSPSPDGFGYAFSRPIACCSTIYKCISKLLCSRLAMVLLDLVQLNQGAFVQGRSIAHNILIFQDLINNYGRTSTSPRCAIKIDLSKAYDTGSLSAVRVLKVALEEFSSATGLHVNTSKSHFFFGGVNAADRQTIAHEI
ncbi:uncharacterized protein LOC133799797 [Humulus lupulus]|uniref:uncharacterized protein LOC133799797 n=1 Tax=Humulus lupulus TaxID=3486 RepID=UPI002B412E60|nr:uncharacterized protein LOC133799797 [Humulus lupulus]